MDVKTMDDWGEIELIPIRLYTDFWTLMDEFENDHTEMPFYRDALLTAFIEHSLYGLRVIPSESMYLRDARQDDVFARDRMGNVSYYLLPCFYIAETQNRESLIWIHSRTNGMNIYAMFQNRLESVLDG